MPNFEANLITHPRSLLKPFILDKSGSKGAKRWNSNFQNWHMWKKSKSFLGFLPTPRICGYTAFVQYLKMCISESKTITVLTVKKQYGPSWRCCDWFPLGGAEKFLRMFTLTLLLWMDAEMRCPPPLCHSQVAPHAPSRDQSRIRNHQVNHSFC